MAEQDLREGRLRLLCATSSMELGIDVGDVERVLQVGCPRTISSTMQRLGRAGHNPGRVSEMLMYPRTASETVYCGMTAQVARLGGVEQGPAAQDVPGRAGPSTWCPWPPGRDTAWRMCWKSLSGPTPSGT